MFFPIGLLAAACVDVVLTACLDDPIVVDVFCFVVVSLGVVFLFTFCFVVCFFFCVYGDMLMRFVSLVLTFVCCVCSLLPVLYDLCLLLAAVSWGVRGVFVAGCACVGFVLRCRCLCFVF